MTSLPLENDREQPLLAVGLWLKEAREQQGKTLDDIAHITRIGKNYLEAIEEGAAARLPNQAYTRGFIRLYAAQLGLSPDEAVRMMNSQATDPPPVTLQGTRPTGLHPQPVERQVTNPGRTRKLLITLVCIVTIAVIAGLLARRNSLKAPSPAQQTATTVQPASAPAPVASGTETPVPKVDTYPAATAVQGSGEINSEEGIVLRLKAVSDGRLHITIDGSISQEYDLVVGDVVEWKADKMFLLDIENAGSVEGELDGKPLKAFGEAGKAAHLIIRQNGIQID